MNRKKAFLSFSAAIFITLITAQAEENVNSTQVQVVKNSNGNQTVVYTGALNSYDNGTWANIELEAGDFMVVFDRDSDDEMQNISINNATEKNKLYIEHNNIYQSDYYTLSISKNLKSIEKNSLETDIETLFYVPFH